MRGLAWCLAVVGRLKVISWHWPERVRWLDGGWIHPKDGIQWVLPGWLWTGWPAAGRRMEKHFSFQALSKSCGSLPWVVWVVVGRGSIGASFSFPWSAHLSHGGDQVGTLWGWVILCHRGYVPAPWLCWLVSFLYWALCLFTFPRLIFLTFPGWKWDMLSGLCCAQQGHQTVVESFLHVSSSPHQHANINSGLIFTVDFDHLVRSSSPLSVEIFKLWWPWSS